MNFSGRHIFVTGGSTGIGRAAAKILALRGARVTIVARSQANLESAAADIDRCGGAVAYEAIDVSDRAALLSAMDKAERGFGAIDGLFANAGSGGQFAPITQCSDENWDNILATNLTPVFVAMRRVLPGMIARKKGSIVVTGSLASERGLANNPGYVASKHAVLGLARAGAVEAAPHGVRVNCVLPGLIETPLIHNIAGDDIAGTMAALSKSIPQGHLGTAEETAEVVAFLLSNAASHVTGQAWAVDGGMLGTLSLEH